MMPNRIAEIAVALGKRQHTVELLAFDPVLELAGTIARVGAELEHGDHDDLHRNGRRLRVRSTSEAENRGNQGENGSSAHRAMLPAARPCGP